MKYKTPLWVGLIIGVVLTPVFLYLAFIYAIHDGFRIAARLFPTAVLLSPDLDGLRVATMVLAVLQWPLYGLILGYCFMKRRRSFSPIIAAFIIIQHLVVGNIAGARVNELPARMKLERDLPP